MPSMPILKSMMTMVGNENLAPVADEATAALGPVLSRMGEVSS